MEKINFQDLPSTTTPLNSANLNQMQDNMENAIIPTKLITISATAPSTATIGDMYYNTTDNKVYTATATNTWDSGTTPRYDGFYINTSDNTLFYYNGTALVGAGGSQTSINVKNEETNSETDVYSCNYVNNMIADITTNGDPVKTGRKIDGKEEYVLRRTVDLGVIEATMNGENRTYTIPTGLNNEKLTRELQGFISLNNAPGIENILGLNMCRFAGTALGNTSSFAYYQKGTHSIIFETAGTDRTDYDLTYELYFVYIN